MGIGWALCSTHRSLLRFSANSPTLATRFGMHQKPHVLPAQGHEAPLEKVLRRSLSNSQSPPGFSGRDSFAPCKLRFGFFERGGNFPILARRELSDRQEGFGGVPDHCQFLGIRLPQMLENFKCAHGVNLPRTTPDRNSFPGFSPEAKNPRTIADAGACNRTTDQGLTMRLRPLAIATLKP